jgi:hypothetical protein
MRCSPPWRVEKWKPGTVWAIDFAEPPLPVDGCFACPAVAPPRSMSLRSSGVYHRPALLWPLFCSNAHGTPEGSGRQRRTDGKLRQSWRLRGLRLAVSLSGGR